jgi:branched-chain amino acid transport system permease protein
VRTAADGDERERVDMGPAAEHEVDDKDILFQRYFDKMQREFLKTLVCDEVIQEHKNDPLGQHSEPLERLLLYFRSLPIPGKYAIKRDQGSATFRIVMLSGVRGDPPRQVDDTKYETLMDAYHGIFLRQVDELVRS